MNSCLLVQSWLWFYPCRPLCTSRLSIVCCVFQVVTMTTTQPALECVVRRNGSVVHLTTPMRSAAPGFVTLTTLSAASDTAMSNRRHPPPCVRHSPLMACIVAIAKSHNQKHRIASYKPCCIENLWYIHLYGVHKHKNNLGDILRVSRVCPLHDSYTIKLEYKWELKIFGWEVTRALDSLPLVQVDLTHNFLPTLQIPGQSCISPNDGLQVK